MIEESGKLEMEGKGFYKSLVKAVKFFQDEKTTGNLLITVRDSLCEDIVSFFKIKTALVIHQLKDLT